MELLPLSLVSISALNHAYWNYRLKKTIDQSSYKMLIIWLCFIFNCILYLPFFVIFSLLKYTISLNDLFYPALFGFFLALYLLFLSKSYSYCDLSVAYPLVKITPIFTLLIGLFLLNEQISAWAFIGIIFIVFGAYSIHLKDFSFKNMVRPLALLKNKGPIFALLAAVMSAFYGTVSKIAIEHMHIFKFCYIGFVFMCSFYFLFIVTTKNLLQNIKSQFIEHKKAIITIGILNFIGYFLVLIALSMSKLSYIFALRQMSILFAIFLGSKFLKEKYGKTRFIAASIIILGVILVGLN